jgi:xylitol oxidase
MGFTPSAGEEIQSEYLLPRRHAVAAIESVRALADRIRPLLLVCEIRTVAADQLWMSMNYQQESVALHFTWKREQDAVEEILVDLEAALFPFDARPHWGKLFRTDAARLAALYPRHADFIALATRLDPRGAFRNPWFESQVLGST